jgi:hypothetical protein
VKHLRESILRVTPFGNTTFGEEKTYYKKKQLLNKHLSEKHITLVR